MKRLLFVIATVLATVAVQKLNNGSTAMNNVLSLLILVTVIGSIAAICYGSFFETLSYERRRGLAYWEAQRAKEKEDRNKEAPATDRGSD
jgi:hypothetical protein